MMEAHWTVFLSVALVDTDARKTSGTPDGFANYAYDYF